jgi:hypothetical protein
VTAPLGAATSQRHAALQQTPTAPPTPPLCG